MGVGGRLVLVRSAIAAIPSPHVHTFTTLCASALRGGRLSPYNQLPCRPERTSENEPPQPAPVRSRRCCKPLTSALFPWAAPLFFPRFQRQADVSLAEVRAAAEVEMERSATLKHAVMEERDRSLEQASPP